MSYPIFTQLGVAGSQRELTAKPQRLTRGERALIIAEAEGADVDFSNACKAAGYESRWAWNQHIDPGPEELRASYRRKVNADNAVRASFVMS